MDHFYREQKTKVCVKCGVKRFLGAFGRSGTEPDRRLKTCKECLPTKHKPYNKSAINYFCKTGEIEK